VAEDFGDGSTGQNEPQKQERMQRKSWAAGQETERHLAYQQYHLQRSESCKDVSQIENTAENSDVQEFVVPPEAMLSLSVSSRRRLGKKRDDTMTSEQGTANSNTSSRSNSTCSNGGTFELRRAPSSLFYLQYDNESNVFDDDDDDDDASASRRKRLQLYADMPSSRKLSAAAYLPGIIKLVFSPVKAKDAICNSVVMSVLLSVCLSVCNRNACRLAAVAASCCGAATLHAP